MFFVLLKPKVSLTFFPIKAFPIGLLKNIRFFRDNISELAEVSIGHSLITESLFLGLENTIKRYLKHLS